MNRRYFGTDGVRGPCDGPVINTAFARRLGRAAARFLKAQGIRSGTPVVLGRDTPRSGEALERAVGAGLAAEGLAPLSLGVIPTPAVARAVRKRSAALGVVITASHNPATDNGVKFFGPMGVKLTDADECEIERCLEGVEPAAGDAPGDATLAAATDGDRDYIEAVTRLLRAGCLEGWRIVVDTANGATCGTSPAVLRALGASVIGIGDAPDGRNINDGVGSEHPAPLAAAVRESGARLGIAHDGDGDRCILCDELGDVLDGDEILTMLAVHALRSGTLPENLLVVTEQSNLGVDAAVQAAGGRVIRTPVGDRYVSERLLAEGGRLGGESSGHIVCAEVSPTGDGLVAALKVIEVMLTTGRPLSELRRVLRKFPQVSTSLPVRMKPPLDSLPLLQAAIKAARADLGARGRVTVRYSGTEPKIRLLVESEDAVQVKPCLDRLVAAVRAELAVEL